MKREIYANSVPFADAMTMDVSERYIARGGEMYRLAFPKEIFD